MPLKAVTFDFHNTLADCDVWFQLEIRELVPRFLDWYAGRAGATVSDVEREAAIGHYREIRLAVMEHGIERDAYDCTLDVLTLLGRDIDRDIVQDGVDVVMHAALPDSTPVPGVVDAVQHLRDRDVELAVISSAVHHKFLEWSLEKFGIVDCFSHVVTSASSGYYKSRTEIYQYTLDQLAVEPQAAVHIGDSYRFDVATATRTGMRTVWFARSDAESDGGEAGLTVRTLEGVAPLILDHFGTD